MFDFVKKCFARFPLTFTYPNREKESFVKLFGWWYVRKRIDHWCSVSTGKSQPSGPPFQWETRQASFPTETVDPRVGIFLSPLNTNDGFYLSQIDCPTPHIHTEFEPFTSCVISLVQYICCLLLYEISFRGPSFGCRPSLMHSFLELSWQSVFHETLCWQNLNKNRQ